MIIKTNLSALNALNQIKKNSHKSSKSLGRLASGMRVQGASDDAAGLVIREKMRAQIRGLHQAARNIEDGISLVQTAEGGLGAIMEPPLQRMRVLAVQAANDTLTDDDRMKIQSEIEQLRTSIDQIAQNTHFNGIKLLNQPEFVEITDTTVATVTTTTTNTKVLPPDIDFSRTFVGAELLDVCYGGGRYVAVGRGGDIMYSDDGSAWQYAAGVPTGEVLNGITYGAGKYVAVGSRGTILTSLDGSTWTSQNTGLTNPADHYIYSVTTDGSRFVAAATCYGVENDKMLVSDDGVNWNTVDMGSSYVRQVGWGGGQFVSINGKVMTSADGISWTDRGNIGFAANDIAYVGGKYIAVGDGNKAAISDDGINWTAITVADNNNVKLYDVAYDGSQIVIVGDNNNDGANRAKIYSSTDGINWKYQDVSDGNVLSGITWANGQFAAVGFYRIDSGGVIDPTTIPEPPPITTTTTSSSSTSNVAGNTTTITRVDTTTTKTTTQTHSNSAITLTEDTTQTAVTTTTTVTQGAPNPLCNVLIQSGPNAGEGINLKLANATALALGISTLDVGTQSGAEDAITTIDAAIGRVSAQRAKFGVYQNRLSHELTNALGYESNLTAAESRISDADMAKEMMEKVKSDMLLQSSQMMLAQANSMPEAVLSMIK